jgi:hypothetical protein
MHNQTVVEIEPDSDKLPAMIGDPLEHAVTEFADAVLDHAVGRPVVAWWHRRQAAKRAAAWARGESVAVTASYRSSQSAPWQRGTLTIKGGATTWQRTPSTPPIEIGSAAIVDERAITRKGATRPSSVVFSCQMRDARFDLAVAGFDALVVRDGFAGGQYPGPN